VPGPFKGRAHEGEIVLAIIHHEDRLAFVHDFFNSTSSIRTKNGCPRRE
jgi:hypothetical protein